MTTRYITIKHKHRSYIAVCDDLGLIRIEYNDAVNGRRNLYLDGELAKTLIKSLSAQEEGSK